MDRQRKPSSSVPALPPITDKPQSTKGGKRISLRRATGGDDTGIENMDLLSVVVEGTTTIHEGNETFVTQKGGKIIENERMQVPVLQKTDPVSMFESRRMLQSTLLLQKKKEMQEVQALLEKKRVEFAKRMEECKEKQEELKAKQKQIRDRVTKFEKFLKENDAKRQRANLKIQSERKQREQREQELSALSKQYHDEIAKAERIKRLLHRYQVYEQYLNKVVAHLPPDYLDVNEPHINDIIMRHKTLRETNEDLIQTLQRYQDEIETKQAQLSEMIKEKNDRVLVFNSTLGTQQKRLDRLKQHCAYLEQKLEERDNSGKERMRVLGETKFAINNLHDRVGYSFAKANVAAVAAAAGPAEVPPLEVMEVEDKTWSEKLHSIQEQVIDMQNIVFKAEHLINQERLAKERKQALLAAEGAL